MQLDALVMNFFCSQMLRAEEILKNIQTTPQPSNFRLKSTNYLNIQ